MKYLSKYSRLRTLLQFLVVAATLLLQAHSAINAASNSNSLLCSNPQTRLPAEAYANLRYLLALQGERDDKTAHCDTCFGFSETKNLLISLSVPPVFMLEQQALDHAPKSILPTPQFFTPLGQRAPPLFL